MLSLLSLTRLPFLHAGLQHTATAALQPIDLQETMVDVDEGEAARLQRARAWVAPESTGRRDLVPPTRFGGDATTAPSMAREVPHAHAESAG
jgi:hypothetical protein